jgi:hypothetical protein
MLTEERALQSQWMISIAVTIAYAPSNRREGRPKSAAGATPAPAQQQATADS